MDGAFIEGREIIGSILLRTNGFVYRCRNDRAYSMLLMEGAVAELTGYPTADFIEVPQRPRPLPSRPGR